MSKRIISCFLTLILGFILGMLFYGVRHPREKPIVEYRVDTLMVCNSIPTEENTIREISAKFPKASNRDKEEHIPLNPKIETNHFADTGKLVTDSVDVLVPITQRVYSDSLYTAYVSGYDPTLDSIRVYSRTITSTKVKQPKWGVSVGVGASIGSKIEPCVFVGLTYTIKTF